MKKELWQVLLQSGLSEEQIKACKYVQRKSGSPYLEVEQKKVMPEKEIEVNPYIRLYQVLAPVLEEDYRERAEGKLLFQIFTELMFEIDRYQGCDVDYFLKEQLQQEIEEGCFGEEIGSFFRDRDICQKKGILDCLLMQYRSREQIYSFVYAMQLVFPSSLIFRDRKKKETLYVCMGTAKRREVEQQYECVKKLFLPMGMNISLAWDNPFVLMDISDMELIGNKMA